MKWIIGEARRRGARVLLVGMRVPSNYGPDYTEPFHAMYGTLARELRVPLVPFLLAGTEGDPTMFQSDQIHPCEAAQPRLLNNVWPTLKPLLASPSR